MAMRRLSVDEEGVSEVVGTILTLLITVALFGSVFATVMQLEGPDDEIRVELDAYFENQGGKNQVIMIHEGGQSLDTDSLTFFLIVDDDRHLESPIEEESSWSVGDNRTLQEENEGEWDIDENSTVELMIRNDDTNRVIYQTMLLEEDRNIIDIRNSRIEYRHEWRNYAEPYEDITIKTEIAAPIWLNNEPFDPEDMWVNASIYQDDVVVNDDGDFISSTNLNHTHNGKFEKRLRIDGGADDARYRIKITAEHPEVQYIDPSYLFLNVGKESLDYYEDKLAIGSLRFEPRSPSHGDDFTLFVEVFNEGEDAQPANWKLTDDRQGTFNSTEPITISHGAAPTLIEVEEPEAYPEGIKGHGPHEITFEIIPEDEDWEGDKWKDEITVDPNIMLVRDTIPEGLYEGEMMENTIRGLNLDYSPFSVGPGEEIADLEKELARHTLTIWMTGNRSGQENYLEDDEVLDSLYDYMEGDLDNADDLNGALWLLGSNLDNIDFGDHDFTDKLGFESFGDNGTFEDETLINPARREDEITITMDKDRDIIAHFKPERVLTIDVDGEGSTDPEVGTHVYEDEEDVTVEATPDEGWYFDGWTGDVTGEKTTIDVTMDEDKEITANFKEKDEHNLTINVEGEGSTNPDVGTRTYEDGEDVTVEATPGDNSYFSHWEGDVPEGEEEEENITIVMDKDKEITAYFVEDGKYLLTIDIEGKGSTDPLEGTHTYEDGDEVNISATPNDDWEFSHWTGDYEGTEKTITITMDENKSITANFERVEYSLTIDFEGEGSVNVNDEEIEDGWTSDYEANTQIELEALPDDDWYFDKWTGDGLEDEKREEITITMDENKSITANFTEIKDHLLRISIKGEGSTDPLEGTHTYEDGEEVNISATPTEGWKFSHWTGEYGGTYGGFDYDVEEGEYVEMNRKDGVNIEDTLAFKEGAEDTSEFFGLGYEAETGQRTAVNSFLFGSITDPGLRSSMAGEVIDWLSNIAIRTGVDVSVTSQRIKPSSPMFRDEINITASFRNNGPRGLDISDTARLVRRHEGTVKDVIAPPTDTDLYLEADGGTAEVTFQWTADELGIHDLLVKADYFGQIDQVYTDNDDITYKNLDVTDDQRFVNVHFSTLVVDAVDRDNSEGFDPAVENVTDSFDRLGHEEGVDYDVFNVTDDNIDSDELQKYNAVVWVTGDNETEVFKQEDVDYILDYLEQESGGNMMFIGENILSSLDSTGINGADDLLEYMGISGGITEDDADPSVLIGEKENDLGRTLRYEVNATSIDTFDSTSDYGEVLFKDEDGNNIASTYADESSGIKTVYLGMNLGRIEAPLIDAGFDDWPGGEVNTSSENAREEFIYNSIWNFGKRDERTELRVTDYDIRSSPPHPQTGRGYSIKARIENIGYESGTALVRFAEGDEHIASQTVTVPGSERIATEGTSYFNVSAGFTTAEVSWTPMDGGMRPIRVRVDPLRSVEEIEPYGEEGTEEKIMEFRNQAKVDQPVYFFYDDMERGDGKWSYDSTLMNIDGDSPLDFMGEAEETHIKDDWNWSLSGSTAADGYRSLGEGEGVYQTRDPEINQFTDNASYSPPRSYWMAEGQGDPEGRMDRAPLDIVLVFDQAMSTGYDEAVDAAEAVIDMLSLEEHGDRIAIIYSTGASAHTELSLSDSENLTKEQIKNRIPDGQPNLPQKALLSGASVAIEELDENGSENAVGGIITITDGLSTQDADQFKYAPGGGSGDEPSEIGAVQWYGGPEGQKGVLGIPYNIMSLSIASEGDDDDDPGPPGLNQGPPGSGGGLNIEPRHHWISATSTADVSYGILEREPDNLEVLYKMFVTDLIQTERGELRSIPTGDSDHEDNDMNGMSPSNNGEVVENTQFFVYSDAFTTGHFDDDIDYYDWEGGDRVPAYGVYDEFDFEIANRGGKDVGTDDWIVAESNQAGNRLRNTVYPRNTLDELKGSYDVNGANVSLFIKGSLELKIIKNGETLDKTIEGDDEYKIIPLEDQNFEISDPEPFEFILENKDGGTVKIDDLVFTYDINYYPPDHEYREKVGTNRTYRYMTTPSMKIGDVEELNSATLEFQNRYRATEGTAGGFIYLWGKNDQSTDWVWNKSNRLYVEPEQSYTGNLNFARIDEQNEEGGPNITGHEGTGDLRLEDREGNIPYWVFNGKSADRTFDWRHTSVNVGRHEDFLKDHDEVRAVFMFAQFGGITREDGWEPEMGWYIDDVRFKASYEWDEDGPGHWKLTNAEGLEEEMGIDINPEEDDEYHDHTLGTEEGHYWIFTSKDNDGNDKLPQGVDSSLYTHPIYLEKAEDPRLSAYMKFNLEDDGEESPPDGFRVEISSDDGRTWQSLTSGNRPTAGTSGDSGYGWKNLDTLSKLNVDLSAWKGEIIRLRFRVFTNTTENNNNDLPKAIFIDDVVVAEADMGIGTSEETSSLQSQETVMTANLEEEAEEEQDESEPESLRMERSTPLDINQMVEATYYQRSTIAFESLTKLVYW